MLPSQDRDRSIHRSRLSKTRCALQIHTHPELSFEELKTAARLAAEMRALEFEVTEKVGKTELVAIYKNGDGPTIMVRTELDALPMEEKTGLGLCKPRQDHLEWPGDFCGA